MPSSNNSITESENLYSNLKLEFHSASDGSIRDKTNQSWMVWNVNDFQRWWNSLETLADVPLGRKLMNCSADQEEFLLVERSLFDVGWLMRKKRQKDILNQRWKLLGWGEFDISNSRISSSLLAPLCGGFALAANEKITSLRKRIQWRQLSNHHIQLEFEQSPNTLDTSPPPPHFFWNIDAITPTLEGDLELDLEQLDFGWTHAGERSCLLPSGLFTRLFESLSFQGILPKPEWSDKWTFPDNISSSHCVSFILIALSVDQMVSLSERPVYIQDVHSWQLLSDAYLQPFGFGKLNLCSSLDKNGGVEFEIPPSPHFPFLVGFLVAYWQRGYCRMAKVSLSKLGHVWKVQIRSLLSYA